jgi:hypothetical protein
MCIRGFFLGVKRQGHEVTTHLHIVPRTKNEWSYTSTPQYAFMARCSVKEEERKTEIIWNSKTTG